MATVQTQNRPRIFNDRVYSPPVRPIKEETFASPSRVDWETNSGIIATRGENNDSLSSISSQSYNTIRQFIRLLQSFRLQLEKRVDTNNFEFVEAMKLSANTLLQSYPEKISIQLTEDNSIFYTMIKNGITIYFEHFPLANLEEIDEAVVSVYEGKKNLFQSNGEIVDVINAINKVLVNHEIVLPEFA